jgi:aminobenzoyl-glutamate utilization protein B
MIDRKELWHLVDARKDPFIELSDGIWDEPELCYAEVRSAALHAAELQRQGFSVERTVAGIPTAVMGEAGMGSPVIAILGEYDALSGLSQKAGVAQRMHAASGDNGHGCGHNLLGAASLLAATAVKDWLAAEGLPGRVRYYGCPAEEGGAAKAFMVRAGAFDDVDVAISWHPYGFYQVMPAVSLANTRIDFQYTGRASHAAEAPHLGRSALDAVELMNVGVNYMREHMPSDARIHYALIDAGGIAPNVVQAHSKVRYAVRARDVVGMKDLVGRVCKIAQGAAMMTETSVDIRIISAMSDLVGNQPLEEAMYDAMRELGAPSFDQADREFARAIQATLRDEDFRSAYRSAGLPRRDAPLCDWVPPPDTSRQPLLSSTDVGDVSWVVPTVQAHVPVFAIGTQLHSWQVVAQGKMPAAHKGMVHAAKLMAATAAATLTDPGLIAAAKADLANRTREQPYVSPLPDGISPPLGMATG